MITHIVMLELQDEADVPEAVQRLNGMFGQIDALESFKAGPDFSGAGFHLALVSTHVDKAALAAYGQHPVHLDVISWLKPRIANRALVDFEG